MYKTSCPFCKSEETLPHPTQNRYRECLDCTAVWNIDLIKEPIDK